MEEDNSDFNKPGYKPKFVSEYSMGALDFERYNGWLKFIEHWSAEINSTPIPNLDMIQHLFSGLDILYDNWRPLIGVATITQNIDKKVNEAKEKKRRWENLVKAGIAPPDKFVLDTVDILMEIKRKLMNMKQSVGLGIIVKRNMSIKEKIRAGMGRTTKFVGLPEA